MKLSQKIILSYVAVLVLIVVLELIHNTFSRYIRRDSDKLASSQTFISHSYRMQDAVNSMESQMRGFLLLSDTGYVQKYFMASASYDGLYKATAPQTFADSAQARLFRKLNTAVSFWRDSMTTPMVLARQDALHAGHYAIDSIPGGLYQKIVLNHREVRQYEHIMNLFDTLNAHQNLVIDRNRRNIAISLVRNDRISLIMAAFILLVGISVAYAATRNITRRMNTMIGLAEIISLGSFNKTIHDEGSDEMSRLAHALNRMSSSLKESFISLEQSNTALLSANRDLEQFVYSASHDLKEPVRMIALYTQLLAAKNADRLDNESLEYLKFTQEGSMRILNLLSNLLNYLHISSIDTRKEKVDIGEVLEHCRQKLSDKIRDQQARIHFGMMPVIDADKEQMEILFYNLVENALKFRSEKKPVVDISVKWEDNMWIFSVKDNGIGIKEAYYHKIFTIFNKLDRTDENSGAGVGLTICKKIVEMHQGKIWVESGPGKGSTFYICLPGVSNS